MYSDKNIVNILTSFLIAKGVRKAVVCPGSRNVPFVNNMVEAEQIECFPVTDERSAGFYALGMSLRLGEPVVVCVTSGSALLNVAPAMAEAYYRHVPVILVSADRPKAWIDRLDGQTMCQSGALKNCVKSQADLTEYADDDKLAENLSVLTLNRCLNEALDQEQGPAHINVHLDEPLFNFTVSALPHARSIDTLAACNDVSDDVRGLIKKFIAADRRLIVIGQLPYSSRQLDITIKQLRKYFVILNEPLSSSYSVPFDKALLNFDSSSSNESIDFLLTMGGTVVSKAIKQYIRSCRIAEHWEINGAGKIHDVSLQQTGILRCSPLVFLTALLDEAAKCKADDKVGMLPFDEAWTKRIDNVQQVVDEYEPPFSQLSAVRELELSLEDMEYDYDVHYANSMAVRLGTLYSQHYIWCNRGINGIEGSLSAAAGFSVVSDSMVFCVIGDLSFFYDQNALWNRNLKGNLRIMLLNNGGGGIFSRLKGLDAQGEGQDAIAGLHITNAKGICEQNDVGYISARSEEEYREGLVHFLTETTSRPMVMEVFTSVADDNAALDGLNKMIIENR